MKVLTTAPDGTIATPEAPDAPPFDAQYAWLCGTVGGPLEAVQMTNEAHAYVCEEGRYNGSERNPAATLHVLAAVAESGRTLIGDIHGTMVVLGRSGADEAEVPERELVRAERLRAIVAEG